MEKYTTMDPFNAFWSKNKKSTGTVRQYIHRTEFEQIFVELNGKLAAERIEKEKYQNKLRLIQHKLRKNVASDVDMERRDNNKVKLDRQEMQAAIAKKTESLKHQNMRLRGQLAYRKKQFEELHENCPDLDEFIQQTVIIGNHEDKIQELKTEIKELQQINKDLRNENKTLLHRTKALKWKDEVIKISRARDMAIYDKHQSRLNDGTQTTKPKCYTKSLQTKKELKPRRSSKTSQTETRIFANSDAQTQLSGGDISFMERCTETKLDFKQMRKVKMFRELTDVRISAEKQRKSFEKQLSKSRNQSMDLKRISIASQETKEKLQRLFVELSRIVASVRSQHLAYRQRSDKILADIRRYIDCAKKESACKQRTLEEMLIADNCIKGGMKGNMVRENEEHTEYLVNMMKTLHQKVHKLIRINAQDTKCDVWTRLQVPSIPSSTVTSTRDLIILFDEKQRKKDRSDQERPSELSKEDLFFLTSMGVN